MNAERMSRHESTQADRARRAQVLGALGDPTRLAVVDLLQVQDMSPDALAAAVEVPGNLLAHHLKVLEGAGVIARVHSQADRRRTYVQLVDGAMDGLLPQLSPISAARVVFVCTHNSARSVLAEALWREASDVPAASAGTHPADRVNPHAVRVAERLGLTITPGGPRSVHDVIAPRDLLISVCDAVNEELGPIVNQRIHWSIADPAAIGTDAAFATAVDELRDRISHLAPRITYRRSTHTRKART